MAAITTVFPNRGAGVDWSTSSSIWTTATNGGSDSFAPSPDTWLFIRCTNPGTITVNVTPAAAGGTGPSGTTISPLALAPVVGASNGSRVYGPFPSVPFADPADGQVHISYTTVSGGNLFAYVAAINFGST
jgi:hypothetical protein